MSDQGTANQDRLHDLLADRALQGLSDSEQQELMDLLAADAMHAAEHAEHAEHVEDVLGYEWAAAAADLPVALSDVEPMPASLRERVEVDAVAFLARAKGLKVVSAEEPPARSSGAASAQRGTVSRPSGTPAVGRLAWLPWGLAAACLAVAAVAWWPAIPRDPAVERQALLDDPGTEQVAWSDARDAGVTGDIVWNNRTQTGFMRFSGLGVNDATKMQYQLWIFDEARKEYSGNVAVDGGVFDIDRATGEMIVPIRAKLEVFDPFLFAITTEPPGGVVKHNELHDPDKYKIILTAQPSS